MAERKSVEDKVAELDKKIQQYKTRLSVLEKQRHELLNPSMTYAQVVSVLKQSDLSPNDVLIRLGLKQEV